MTGRMLGHYRIVEKIGAGGMGDVYRARDEHLARDVAIKVLPPSTLSNESARKHFHKEALILSQLNHPNVATIYDFDTHQGVDFLVMEYIPGVTLSERLAAGPLPEKEVAALGTQLAEGLSAAHEFGVVHRDLKPGNLRLTVDGRLKILDFGLAKLRAPVSPNAITESVGESQTIAGTLPYMAPEQLLMGEIDARTDIWGAGCVLYEMATGRCPFVEKVSTATADAILHKPCSFRKHIQASLSPQLEEIVLKCLEKEPADRYQSAAELAIDLRRTRRAAPSPVLHNTTRGTPKFLWQHRKFVLTAAILFGVAIAATFFTYSRIHTALPLTERDTIMLADFTNTTGDPVFDDALKQAVAIQLGQSPFLELVSQSRINKAQIRMGHTSTQRVTGETAREICRRIDSKAVIEGSIASLGNQYVLGLKAVNCVSGDVLNQGQNRASRKEDVLNALDDLAARLRRSLGESLSTIQKFNTPMAEATTSSLEALQALSQGDQNWDKGLQAALPFYQHAIELDPSFAMAYMSMAGALGNSGRTEESVDYTKKAYLLREHITERERLLIEGRYYMSVTGELERARQVYEVYKQAYPRSGRAYNQIGVIYCAYGQYEKALAEHLQLLRLVPDSSQSYGNTAIDYLALNRLDDAEHVLAQARAGNLGGNFLAYVFYLLAFLRGDEQSMSRILSSTNGDTEAEYMLFGVQAETEAYYGRMKAAREFSRRAQESALRAGNTEIALGYQLESALREADMSNTSRARQEATAAIAHGSGWGYQPVAALTLARLGDPRANSLKKELQQRHPLDTLINNYWIPSVEAASALRKNNAASAIEILRLVTPYESGLPIGLITLNTAFYPVYLRGQAYLKADEPASAEREFQKILNHPGIATNAYVLPLAQLGLARARALANDTTGARAAYQKFFAIWKDADPDISILQRAKAEYATLQ